MASLRRTFHDDAAAFNAEFDAHLRSFDDLAGLTKLPRPKTERAREALAAFVAEAATRYFQITTAAVRRHDAKHLVLGCRFAHDAPDSAWRAAGATCDLVAVNVYPRIDLGRQRTVGLEKHLRHCFARCGKPLIVTEWGFPAWTLLTAGASRCLRCTGRGCGLIPSNRRPPAMPSCSATCSACRSSSARTISCGATSRPWASASPSPKTATTAW